MHKLYITCYDAIDWAKVYEGLYFLRYINTVLYKYSIIQTQIYSYIGTCTNKEVDLKLSRMRAFDKIWSKNVNGVFFSFPNEK